ncbi:MAG TPA: transposase [Lysobacter sp.]|jgi:transposase|nr:transposase [Lysobacter sp.]
MKRESDAAAKRARRRYSAEFRRQVVEQTLVPGVSVAKIALDHRLNTNLVFTWRRKHLRELAELGQAPKMLPVMVEPSPMLEGKPAPRAVAGSVIEIELAAGRIRLKGAVDVDALRAVVDLLSHR